MYLYKIYKFILKFSKLVSVESVGKSIVLICDLKNFFTPKKYTRVIFLKPSILHAAMLSRKF